MNYMNSDSYVLKLYDYAIQNGFSKESLFGKETQEFYINTSLDAYRDYALFEYLFKGKYNVAVFDRLMSVDFRSRLGIMAGVSSSNNYESIMLLEPPNARTVGMSDYVKVAKLLDYTLLLQPAMHRMEDFEKFSANMRKEFLDDKTWYLYVFATKHEYMGQGYGKKLMSLLLAFANENEYKICLETNETDNVKMYEHFGFETVSYVKYQDVLEHYTMTYG